MKLKDIMELMKVIHGKKIPCDIAEILEEEYKSKSKNTIIKYGDMDIIHFLRMVNNNNLYDELVKANSRILKLEKTLDKIQHDIIMEVR